MGSVPYAAFGLLAAVVASVLWSYWPIIGLREGLKRTIDWYKDLKANQRD